MCGFSTLAHALIPARIHGTLLTGKTTDNSANVKMGHVLGATLENGPYDPDD